jgi:hypothetical protein
MSQKNLIQTIKANAGYLEPEINRGSNQHRLCVFGLDLRDADSEERI